MELRQKGLDDEAIEQALDSVDDNESALVCLEKKYRRQALPWDDRRKRNAMNFLRRRGFPSDVAYDCLRRFIASERSGLAGD
jgi:SOS response regulatory protein OraA/RecX